MSDVKDMNRHLREIVRSILGMPQNSVRPANQNAPTGTLADQFATVLITAINDEGQDSSYLKNETSPSKNVAETVAGMRKIVASVQFFRGDAYTKACRLRTLLSTTSAALKLQAAGLGFIRASTAKNLTSVMDTYWEERGQIDIELYLIAAETSSVETFGRFPVSGSNQTSTINTEVFEP